MTESNKRPTLKDIAERAHVSVSAVSKALRDQGHISPQLKIQIREIAREIGYDDNRMAASQRMWHSGMVGLITADLVGQPSMSILNGVEQELGAAKHSVLLANAHGDGKLEQSHIERLIAHGVDGFIIAADSIRVRPPIQPDIVRNLPTVYAFGVSSSPQDCSVTCDNKQAGRDAIMHLATQGCTRIAVIAGMADSKATADRLHGAQQAFDLLRSRGVRLIATPRFGKWTELWGAQAAELLLSDGQPFDGLYCFNDQIARGAIDVLQRHGIGIPGDVAVIGHDNWNYVYAESPMSISSIDSNTELIGRTAARYLLDAISGNPHQGVTYLPCTVVERHSSARK